MQQVLFGGGGGADLLPVGATEYARVTHVTSWGATERSRRGIIPSPGTVSAAAALLTAAPGAGQSYVFTLRKNEADTALVITVADGNVTAEDAEDVHYDAGDSIDWKCVGSAGAAAAAASLVLLWTGDVPGVAIALGGKDDGITGTETGPLLGGMSNFTSNVDYIWPTNATITAFYGSIRVMPTDFDEAVGLSIQRNGVHQTESILSFRFNEDDVVLGVDGLTMVVVPGDDMEIRVDGEGAWSGMDPSWGIAYRPAIDGESVCGGGTISNAPTTAGTYYNYPNSGESSTGSDWTATEADRTMLAGAPTGGPSWVLRKMHIWQQSAAGTGDGREHRARVDGNNGTVEVIFGATLTEGSDTTHEDTIAPGDTLSQQLVILNSPSASDLVWTFVQFIDPGDPPDISTPEVTSVTPNSGTLLGGTPVTIAGTGFEAGAVVHIGARALLDVTVVSATEITGYTPPGLEGARAVVVENTDGGYDALASGYTYAAQSLALDSVTPEEGPPEGGTAVVIAGTGFRRDARFRFDDEPVASTPDDFDSTIASAETPAHALGAVEVSVRQPAHGASVTLETSTSARNDQTSSRQVVSLSDAIYWSRFGAPSYRKSVNDGASFAAAVDWGLASAVNADIYYARWTNPAFDNVVHMVEYTDTGTRGAYHNSLDLEDDSLKNVTATLVVESGAAPSAKASVCVAPDGTVYAFAGMVGGKSVDGGANWTEVLTPSETVSDPWVAWPDFAAAEDDAIMCIYIDSTILSIKRYTPSTNTWAETLVTGGTGVVGNPAAISGTLSEDGHVLAAVVSADGSIRTFDIFGATITERASIADADDECVALARTPDGIICYYVRAGELYARISRDEMVTWGPESQPLGASHFVGISSIKADPLPLGPSYVIFQISDDLDAFGVVEDVVVLADAFTFVEAADPPTLDSITPNSGSESGGTAVTLAGSNFVDGATVTIGGTPATSVVFVGATEITAVTPAGAVGARNVVVTNPDAQSDTLVGGFTYIADGGGGDPDPDPGEPGEPGNQSAEREALRVLAVATGTTPGGGVQSLEVTLAQLLVVLRGTPNRRVFAGQSADRLFDLIFAELGIERPRNVSTNALIAAIEANLP